ncbi:MAG: hydroxymethylbilane synthase [bacterium]|nr:hydroxymethylbilane synthase [bacterium]
MMRIATRGSELALWQANWVQHALRSAQGVEADLVILKTEGDRVLDRSMASMEGKGFFTKEIEDALLDDRADVAVHSYKDLPTEPVPGLVVAAVPPRAPVNDLLLIHRDRADHSQQPWPLAKGARIGTSATRRIAQLRAQRGDLEVVEIRGNVPTRLRKARDGTCDAVILAQAGLERLGLDLSDLLVVDLLATGFLPAPAQGALAIQCRTKDAETLELLQVLHDPDTATCVDTERILLGLFEGGCSLPLGCIALTAEGRIQMRAAWLKAEGDLRTCTVAGDSPETVAREAYRRLNHP